jgi:hypothetical protein
MIDRFEIMEFSHEVGLAPEVVEKDYVLGWVLGGIFNHPSLQNDWLFKGGTLSFENSAENSAKNANLKKSLFQKEFSPTSMPDLFQTTK